jgi:hypothetical protein
MGFSRISIGRWAQAIDLQYYFRSRTPARGQIRVSTVTREPKALNHWRYRDDMHRHLDDTMVIVANVMSFLVSDVL